MERKTSQSTLEKLAAIIEDFQNNDDLEQFKGLLLEVDEQDLNKYNCSGLSLLQKGCYESKTHLGNNDFNFDSIIFLNIDYNFFFS